MPMKVAVIGGGTAGVVAARYLLQSGHQPQIFEAAPTLGGIWGAHSTNHVVYSGLKTNLPTTIMQSFDLDFPKGLPSFTSAQDLEHYLRLYSEVFGVSKLTNLSCVVISVSPIPNSRWLVRWQKNGEIFAESFDAVVVATGHYETPFKGEIEGQAAWLAENTSREVLHSKEYAIIGPSYFKNSNVLVIGARPSGTDTSREIREHASFLYVVDKACTAVCVSQNCAHVPRGARLSSGGHLYLGSEKVPGPPIDKILLCTGYLYNFPFLNAEELEMEWQRYVSPLYMHVIHARRPTLAFVGLPSVIPCPIPCFEAQSLFLSEFWARRGQAYLKSEDERVQWVAERRKAVGDRRSDTHVLGFGCFDYMRELVQLAGVKGAAYDRYDSRVTLLSEMMADLVSRYPKRPWEEDSYRRLQYKCDPSTEKWTVTDPRSRL